MRRLGLWVVLALAASCSRCGKKPDAGTATIERVLPRNAVAVVVVPSLKDLGGALSLLERVKVAGFIAPLRGFPTARAFVDELVKSVGVDPRSPAELEKVGLDPSRGAAVAVLLTGDVYLVAPVKDEKALRFRLESTSARLYSAGTVAESKQGTTFSTKDGRARVGYAIAEGFAFIGRDEVIPKLREAAALASVDRLDQDQALAALRPQLAPHVAYAWLPSGSVALQQTPLLNALVSVSLTPTALDVRVTGAWKGAPELLTALTPRPGAQLSPWLPADAFVTARYTGDAKGLATVTKDVLGPYLARAFEQSGFDVKAEVLDRVLPGTVFSLSLADRPPMDRGVPSFDIRKTNPFAYAHLTGVAPVDKAEVIAPTLDKVALAAPKFGAKLEKVSREGRDVYFTTWSQGEGVHFAAKGPHLVFGSPVQRLDAVATSAAAAGPVGESATALALSVDLTKLSASVRALPESAWGLGGFALKPTTVRWLDATDDLKAVRVELSAKDSTVRARLTLELAIAPAAEPSAKVP